MSVVIITKNQRPFLARSLPALAAQTGLPGPVEVIVVDSGSTDGARGLARDAGARLIDLPPERFNYARAYNVGAAAACAPFLARLSGDAVPAADRWLAALLAPLLSDPTVAATWGRQTPPLGVRNPVEAWHEAWLRPAATGPRRYTHPVTVLGSGMALRRDLWEAFPFPEALPQAEDYAWLVHWLRRGRAGVYVPDAVIRHGHHESVGRALRRSIAQSALQGWALLGGAETSPRVDARRGACYHPMTTPGGSFRGPIRGRGGGGGGDGIG